jgi:penicillin-binding protein 2
VRSSRAYQIFIVFGLFLFIIILRLFYLQIKQKNVLVGRGEKNFLKIEVLAPLRGNLLDCNGTLLAANQPVFDLYWQGSGQTALTSDKLEFFKNLGSILNENFENEAFLQNLAFAEKFSRRMLISKNIKFDQLCQISEQSNAYSNLIVENRFERIYPHGVIASHVLGFLSRVEKIGKSGVEKILQDSLQGQEGYILSVTNSTGKKLQLKEFKQAKAGTDIMLTLDLNLQKMAESFFTEDQSGAFILMNPRTGAIKALVSFPNYDPNIFSQPISMDDWNEKMSDNNPLLNRATAALYPPASTFKLVTIAAGLEHGYISSNTEFNCPGYFLFHGRKYACMHKLGHGNVTPRMALAYSCNVYCFEIARKIKIDELAFYAKKFGLGQKTNFLLYEKEGLIPTTAWKLANKKEKWWKGETVSASIGQSFLMVTPLQIARMVSAICTGHLIKPRILEQESVEIESLEISKYTQHILRDGMKMAVQLGSGKLLSYIKSFDIYAKTGTAQTCNLRKEKSTKKQMEHGWFSAFFYYKNEEPLVLTVVVENAGSSGPALQIANKFLRAYKKFKEPDNEIKPHFATDESCTQSIL